MSLSLAIAAALILGGLLYRYGIRRWYQSSDAGRVDPRRAMSGDADLLSPDHESTLRIAIDAPPADVWMRLLELGRSPRSQRTTRDLSHLKPGDVIAVSFAPDFPILDIEPERTLVLGGRGGALQWRWQFELYAMDIGRTRLISRARLQAGETLTAALFGLILQPVSFVIMRKMLLDVKRRAELTAHDSRTASATAA